MPVVRNEFQSVLNKFKTPGLYAIDCETSGLFPYNGDRLFSIILCDSENEAYYFNFNEDQNPDEPSLLPRNYLKYFQEIFDVTESTWVGHNLKFDLHVLAQEGLEIRGKVVCTMIRQRLIYNRSFNYDLDTCVKPLGLSKSDAVWDFIMDNGLWEWQRTPGKKAKFKKPFFNKVPLNVMVPYGKTDAVVARTLKIWQDAEFVRKKTFLLNKRSEKINLPLYADVVANEDRLLRTCFEMERHGILIDTVYCEKAIAYEEKRMNEAVSLFKQITGMDFADSRVVFKEAFEKAGETIHYTAKNNATFDDDVLLTYTSPVANVVKVFRDSSKRMNTYYRNYLKFVDDDGYLHYDLKQAGTDTGRFCVAKGTYVDMPRDLSTHPKGIRIEDVQPGDLVYTYDADLQLKLKPVVWAGKTGHKKVLRIHWMGQGRKHRGYLDVTPEHEIRLIDGSYVKAKDLKKNDSILAVSEWKAKHIVTSLEELHDSVDVYDLEVEETHNFIANELCVHNSCSSPNLQNVPKEDNSEYPVRKAFIPPDDYCLVRIDYDQVEYRLMLNYAKEMGVIKKIKEQGLDVHQATADMLGVPRNFAKTLNFLLLYGGGIEKLAGALNITLAQAAELRRVYFANLPAVSKWTQGVKSLSARYLFIVNWMGRVCEFLDASESYKAPNHLIQGGVADIIKVAMNNTHERLAGMRSKQVLQVHDELVFYIHKDELEIVPELVRIMENVYTKGALPLTAGVSHSWHNWYDKVEGLPHL